MLWHKGRGEEEKKETKRKDWTVKKKVEDIVAPETQLCQIL